MRYIVQKDENSLFDKKFADIHLFYLHWRIHFVGWTLKHSPVYTYEIPDGLELFADKQSIIDFCSIESTKQFLPENLFSEQEEIREHRFIEGMKLEVFDWKTQNIYLGLIQHIHNQFYFDVQIDDDRNTCFVAYATHPFLLPAHWAVEHRFALMKGNGVRLSEDYWNVYTEKHGFSDIAPESCFHLITLNHNGSNRVEPGMKLEMILTIDNDDQVFSSTLVTVIDHLMWIRIDNPVSINEIHSLYQVVPINSLDIFPIGWAKYNGFSFIMPIEYKVEINIYEQDRNE